MEKSKNLSFREALNTLSPNNKVALGVGGAVGAVALANHLRNYKAQSDIRKVRADCKKMRELSRDFTTVTYGGEDKNKQIQIIDELSKIVKRLKDVTFPKDATDNDRLRLLIDAEKTCRERETKEWGTPNKALV